MTPELTPNGVNGEWTRGAGSVHARGIGFPFRALTPYGGNRQLGAGLSVKEIRGRPYLYFWRYEPRSWGTRRVWTYVGPVGKASTRVRASWLLLDYHLKVRKEVDRRIERLSASHALLR